MNGGDFRMLESRRTDPNGGRLETPLGRRLLVRHSPLPHQRAAALDERLPLRLVSEAEREGSAYSLALTVPSEGFAVTEGEPELGEGPSANPHFFCPRCKNWLFLRLDALGIVNVRPAMLDEHGWFKPFIEIFVAGKLPWAATSAAHSFATQPEPQAFGRLIEAFAREGARPV